MLDVRDNAPPRWAAWLLLLLALSGIALVTMAMFRIGVSNLTLAWQVNTPRLALAAAAGSAYAVGFAHFSRSSESQLGLWHSLGFVVTTLVVSALVLPAVVSWSNLTVLLVTLVALVTLVLVIRLLIIDRSSATLVLGLLLLGAVLVSVLNFAGVSLSRGVAGSLGLWLMGDVSASGLPVYLLLLLVIGLVVFCCSRQQALLPRYALIGIGIGAAGPVFFLGWLVPAFVSRFTGLNHGALWLSACAVVGAFTLVLADALMRLALGGYAPPVGLTIAMVSAPFALWHLRRRLLQQYPSHLRGKIEGALIISSGVLGLAVIYHIIAYAQSAT